MLGVSPGSIGYYRVERGLRISQDENLVLNNMKVYFAHPVSDYGKPREEESLRSIEAHFPGAEILNPNQPHHHEAYKAQGMAYFEQLVLECDSLVAVPFKDGEWGMGVWREAESMARKGGRVFILDKEIKDVDFKAIRPLSINQTRERVKNNGNKPGLSVLQVATFYAYTIFVVIVTTMLMIKLVHRHPKDSCRLEGGFYVGDCTCTEYSDNTGMSCVDSK